MPDRHVTPETDSPEEQLDRWLDALNDPDQAVLPEPPQEIAGVAGVARRYYEALGTPHMAAQRHAYAERGGEMTPRILATTTPLPQTETAASRETGRMPGWLSTISIAAVLALLIGGGLVQLGWPGQDYGPASLGLMAPGTATPAGQPLACGSPDHRPIVEGEVDAESLAAIGITETPLQVVGDKRFVPTSSGEIVEIPDTWMPLGGPLWLEADTDNGSATIVGEVRTVHNIETGNEWEYLETFGAFYPTFSDPFLILPVVDPPSDWRIIDIETGEERLVSEIRGEPFEIRTGITPILPDYSERYAQDDEKVLLFSRTYPTADSVDTIPEVPGPNILILGDSLDDARFLEDNADALYFHQVAVSPSTGEIAFATNTERGREIAIVDPISGERIIGGGRRLSEDARPLMFSDDASTLVLDQPGALFALTRGDDGSVAIEMIYEDETFVPVAFNSRSMTVLVMYEDRHLAMVDTHTSEITDLPDVTVPVPEYLVEDPMFRMAFEQQIYRVFNPSTGRARFINLETGTVSEPTMVFVPDGDSFDAAIQPGYWIEVRYPFIAWTDAYGYLDESGTFRAISVRTDEEMWSIPAPDGFAPEPNQVVDITYTPGQDCLVLNVIRERGSTIYREGEELDRVTTWIAPMGPDATWTRLDFAITGWWEVYEAPQRVVLPAPEPVTPIASP